MIDKLYRRRLNLLLFLFVLGFSFEATFAQGETHPGVVQYKAGNNAQALQSLSLAVKQKEYKASGEMWNYLGLAHLAADENKKARKAFDKAIKLDPAKADYRVNSGYAFLLLRKLDQAQNEIEKALKLDPNIAAAYYIRGVANLWEGKFDAAMSDADRAMRLDPTSDTGYTLKSDTLVAMLGKRIEGGSSARQEIDLFRQAVDTLTLGAGAVPKGQDSRKIDEELEAMKTFYAYFSRELPDPAVPKPEPDPGVTQLKIVSKQRAQYTDSARQAGIQGTITIAVLFGASGRIEHTLLIKRLGYGLDEQALKAARMMRFEPKKKDGAAVSTVRLVSFSFNIY